jgi:hypothetical protein
MLHSLVTAASEVAGEEPSKTAFYVMGGVLALWAVVVSALGISRHDDFPSSDGAARGIMGISVVLVAAAMATAVITA